MSVTTQFFTLPAPMCCILNVANASTSNTAPTQVYLSGATSVHITGNQVVTKYIFICDLMDGQQIVFKNNTGFTVAVSSTYFVPAAGIWTPFNTSFININGNSTLSLIFYIDQSSQNGILQTF